MFKRTLIAGLGIAAVVAAGALSSGHAEAAPPGQPTNWQRFYHYPYVYYPHNFQQQPESRDHLYYRYSQQQQIPVYNKDWYNFYPTKKPYHWGNHYTMDVF
ncbi:hypothetical protein SH661x_003986 [Planctomicrobium sp. SH661]|uniref:hypothetical protein n=1 Tax=Planctomicrobium sp. SH661 TaxID=3448124 RepID=UPI003F5B591D